MSITLSRRSLVSMLAVCPLCAAADAAEPFVCVPGKEQSPIDLSGAREQTVKEAIEIHYNISDATMKRVGESFKLYPKNGGYIKIDGDRYDLYEFHFHHPAEHKLSGSQHPMECHFVNKKDKQYAVVGVFLRRGAPNPTIGAIWQNLPPPDDSNGTALIGINPRPLLPEKLDGPLYRYKGSLTTAPFPAPEGLIWSVYQKPVEVSPSQIAAYQCMYPPNARPVQAPNGRPIQLLKVGPA